LWIRRVWLGLHWKYGDHAGVHSHIDAALVVVGADPPIAGEELVLVEAVGKQVQDLIL